VHHSVMPPVCVFQEEYLIILGQQFNVSYCEKLCARATHVALSAATGSLMVLLRKPAVLALKDLDR
jgi:hypothetical protein